MDLKGILAISGYPGLFKMVKQAKNSIIVESLDTKKRMPAYATSKISALEDIAIFTTGEDVALSEILKTIYKKENGGPAISHKASANELTDYVQDILPEYDKDRVYVSDMKRIINWYNILQKHGLVDLENAPVAEESKDDKQEDTTDTAEVKDDAVEENKTETDENKPHKGE